MTLPVHPLRDPTLRGTIYIPTLVFAAGRTMMGPALPLYAESLGVEVALIGLLVGVGGLGATLSDVPAGVLASRVGGRRGMQAGVALCILGALGLAASQSTAQLFVAQALSGAGFATYVTCRLTFVAAAAPTAQRGRALALLGGTSRIGMSVGPFAGGLIGAAFGLPATFLAFGVVGLAVLLWLGWQRDTFVPPPDTGERAHARVLATLAAYRGAFLRYGTVAIALVTMRSARALLIPLWGSALGFGIAEIGLVVSLSTVVDMTLFHPVGVVMDRWGRKFTIVPCLLTLALFLGLVPFTESFAGYLGVALLGGLGNGLGSGAIMTMGADIAPRERGGEVIGVWRLISDAGAALSPIAVGAVAQAWSLATAFGALACVGVAAAVFMGFFVRDGLKGAH